MKRVITVNVILYISLLSIFTLLTVPPVKCKGPSKWEILQFLMSMRNNNPFSKNSIFKRFQEMPLMQFIKTVNDVVEPVVTAAEVLLLLEQLSKRDNENDDEKDKRKKKEPPIHVTTKDQIMVFSGHNQLEVNHFKKPTNNQPIKNVIDEGGFMPYAEQSVITEEFTPAGAEEPMLLSSRVRQSPTGDDNYFQLNLESDNSQEFRLARDLPKNFFIAHSNPVQFHQVHRGKRRRKPLM